MNDGPIYLTEYQVQIIRLMVTSASTYEIARMLGTSRLMLAHNLTKIYRKLGMRGRSELIVWAYSNLEEVDDDSTGID